MPETKAILKDLLNLSENKVTMNSIQTIVCQFFKISKNEMLSAKKIKIFSKTKASSNISNKNFNSKSLPEIGREFSNRDHTTIIHSVKTIEKLKEKDVEMIENINKLKNKFCTNNQDNEI